ncbi:class I lanthipeptide [Spirosoma soli]|uniref:Class I lanthipeptide n=1 Tax=Spirosoma soli TaxID=1770529 RepID=A0ABW5M949_9BACT
MKLTTSNKLSLRKMTVASLNGTQLAVIQAGQQSLVRNMTDIPSDSTSVGIQRSCMCPSF